MTYYKSIDTAKKTPKSWHVSESPSEYQLIRPVYHLPDDNWKIVTYPEVKPYIFHVEEVAVPVIKEISELELTITESKSMLDLEEGWDDEGALPIKTQLWLKMSKFLWSYNKYIFGKYHKSLVTPDIAPVPDGSIDLTWRLNNSRLLINFQGSEAIYYGDLGKDIDSIKGKIDTMVVKGFLASWMEENLTN